MNIPFIDLQSQFKDLETQINSGIQDVLAHGKYIMGPEIAKLEQQLAAFCGSTYALTCSSGTDALMLALMAKDIGPGDAVFTTPFTFFATAEVISLLGAQPVFVDIDPRTFNMDPAKLKVEIERVQSNGELKARAVMPVNLFGLPPEFDQINAIAQEHDMFVVEDTAQGFGGKLNGKISGNLADISATSFFPAKPLGCYGDGGAVFTSDQETHERMASLRVHGKGTDKYDNVRVGLNARLDTLQAAILLPKLAAFPSEIIKRQRIAEVYSEHLSDSVTVPFIPDGYESVWAQYSILTDKRDAVRQALSEKGIPSVVYYPIPCHLAGAFKSLGYKKGDFPVSEATSGRILSLPMHPYLEEETVIEISRIIQRTVHP